MDEPVRRSCVAAIRGAARGLGKGARRVPWLLVAGMTCSACLDEYGDFDFTAPARDDATAAAGASQSAEPPAAAHELLPSTSEGIAEGAPSEPRDGGL